MDEREKNYKKELAKDLWEKRRFELAEYLYSKEKGCFCSDKEKAERAVHKADILLDMLKK